MSLSLSRQAYAGRFGHHRRPCSPCRYRDLIEIEKDFTVYGDEVKFGGGKVIRDGRDESPLPGKTKHPPLDLVITNAVVLDHWGIVKGTSAFAMADCRHWQGRQPLVQGRRRSES